MNQPLALNIEDATLAELNYREIVYTSSHLQLVLMSLLPGENIPWEIHDGDQFVRIEAGVGQVQIENMYYHLYAGVAVIIPAGYNHKFTNTGMDSLKMYVIYSPPQH